MVTHFGRGGKIPRRQIVETTGVFGTEISRICWFSNSQVSSLEHQRVAGSRLTSRQCSKWDHGKHQMTLFCHSFWHLIWKYIWYLFFWHSLLAFYFGILSDILYGNYCGVLSGIYPGILPYFLAFYPTFFLTFYLASMQTFFLASILAFYHILSGILSDSLFRHSIWLFWHSFWHQFWCSILAISVGSAWGPAVPTEIWSSWCPAVLEIWSPLCDLEIAVEVRQCLLKSGTRGLGPAGARGWRLAVEGPAVPTVIWSLQLIANIFAVRQSSPRSGARSWGSAAHWDLEFPVGRKEGEEGWKEEVTMVKSRDHLAGGKNHLNTFQLVHLL